MFLQLLILSFFGFGFSAILPATVNELNVNSYLGHWFQVYGAPTNYVFQGYGTCITADYGLLENGNINVVNTQINENQDTEQITGYAYYKNLSEPGKLTVHLEEVPVDSPYWIVKLGEIKKFLLVEGCHNYLKNGSFFTNSITGWTALSPASILPRVKIIRSSFFSRASTRLVIGSRPSSSSCFRKAPGSPD